MLTRRDALALPLVSLLPPLAAAPAADDADPTKVFRAGEKSLDKRLGPPRTLDTYAPFVVPKTKAAWEARRTALREQLLVATGLWPLPDKTPLNPVVHGKVERDGYTIEKVFFASMPGHYVSGNLYRPLSGGRQPPENQKSPGVLFAHGHWLNGRFHDAGEKAAAESVKAGGEPDPARGRFFMQAIPITLARLGFVVFQYDTLGNADSRAVPHGEGFADAAAELRAQSSMGLQTWNSVRALDFLAGLPDVDPKRLGMTGASGGGTQTFMLAALDDRLAAAFPAVMVSTAMQGGCVCENCSGLRVGTGNVEIAGLFAPKPMAFSCANDWTKEFLTKGFPELQQLYKLYGAEDKVAAKAWLEYGHQYNVHARQFMYSWFQKHLQGKDGAVKEPAYKPTPPTELSVYDAAHPRPKDELDVSKLREAMAKASDAAMAKLVPTDAKSLAEFRRVVGTALRAVVGHGSSDEVNAISYMGRWKVTLPDGCDGLKRVLTRVPAGTGAYQPLHPDTVLPVGINRQEVVPYLVGWAGKRGDRCVVWIHPKGKASLFDGGKWTPPAQRLVDAGCSLFAIDVLRTGEQVGGKPAAIDPKYAGYTFGYNRSLLADRVRDILAAVEAAQFPNEAKTVDLVGWGDMGPVAVLAKALAGDKVTKLAADLNGFRFENIKDAADPMMLPGAVKYGGLPAFLALCAPGEVLVHNHRGTATGQLPTAAYKAAGAADKLTRSADKLDDAKVVEWLLK